MNQPPTYAALEDEILAFIAGNSCSESVFNTLALRIHAFQRQHNAPYAAYCDARSNSGAPSSWKNIPALPQSIFKNHALRCFPAVDDIATFRTSGTTGEGFGTHHYCSLRLYKAAALAGWRKLQLPNTTLQLLTQSPATAPHSSLSYMMGVLADAAPAAHYYLQDNGELDDTRLLQTLESTTEPIILAGTALAFLHLFETMEKSFQRFRPLPKGSTAMETGGYKGSRRTLDKASLYAQFSQYLGLAPDAIINEYGMTELSSQFYTRGLTAPHCCGHWLRAVVINPETNQPCAVGETGTLRIFDLANLGSTLALQTRDLAIAAPDGAFFLIGRDPSALPRGCSRSAEELLTTQ